MPQISKVRIVNFLYNDGKRFIADELFDLSSSDSGEALNSLLNLNNGGGKTVLVQLMLQPVHPTAKAGGRRIEDYFVRPGDHSYILLEWNLDGSTEKLLTGVAMATGLSNSGEENQRGRHVRYYTFKTTYEKYSPYGIAALELSKNENGRFVPESFEYVREKAKASKGVLTHYSSDETAEWAEMLSEEYGINRTEWETVLETLNEEEGGLNQYFDEAKTSDKLISKFFIPAIEQKLMSTASKGADSSLETMLINYAKKITEKEKVIRERDTNKSLLVELSGVNDLIGKLYVSRDKLEAGVAQAYGFQASLKGRCAALEVEINEAVRKIEEQKLQITHVEHEEKSKEYYDAQELYQRTKTALEEVGDRLEKCKTELCEKRHAEDVLACAKLYGKICDANARISELKKLIEDKENNSEDAERIASLKYSVMVKAGDREKVQAKKICELEERIGVVTEEFNENDRIREKAEKDLEKAEDEYRKADANLEAAKKNTDRRIESLQMELTRKLDGFYSEEEVDREKDKKRRDEKRLEEEAQGLEKRIGEMEDKREEIPKQEADLRIKEKETASSLQKAELEMESYDSLCAKLAIICDRYGLDHRMMFSEGLGKAIQEEMEHTQADLAAAKQERHLLEDKKKAAGEGYLHILPEIMRYVQSTGIPCRTGEEYVCGLMEDGKISCEKTDELFSKYPEFAYSLLFDTEKEKRKLLDAGNIDWLRACIPLFTMEQVEHAFDGKLESMTFLAACDKSFFADRRGYIDGIGERIVRLEDRLAYLEEHLKAGQEDLGITDEFRYAQDWRKQQEELIESFKREQKRIRSELEKLGKESQTLKEEIADCRKELSRVKNEMQELRSWMQSFAEFCLMLSEEIDDYNGMQKAYETKSKAERDYKKACEVFDHCEKELRELNQELGAWKEDLEKTRRILEEVNQAKESVLTEGDLETLYSQYNTLLKSMHDSMEGLKRQLKEAQDEKGKDETELSSYNCEETEYRTVIYSGESFLQSKKEREELEERKETIQTEYNQKNGEHKSAETGFQKARDSLADYGGTALPREAIGDSFRARIKSIGEEIKALGEKAKADEKEKSSLEKILERVDEMLYEYPPELSPVCISLWDMPADQFEELKKDLKNAKRIYEDQKGEVGEKLRKTIADFKDIALAEIVVKLDAVRMMMGDAGIKGDRLFTASESIDTMIASIEKINSKIETDLREIENDFQDIVNQCFVQGKKMYTDLRMIAGSSKAHIYDGKPQTQMVKMDLPEETEISEEASRASVKNEIEKGANELRELIKRGEDLKLLQKRAKVIIGSERLLHRYIRKDTISVKVFKIDYNSANSSYKKWEDTLTQSSGAEKFVAFFSVVLTLMNYTRSASGLISRNAKSVLILDNPFGSITSAHLLRPMFDIAKHFNVQLICLSDINKSEVINCFDCVIKLLIKPQTLSNFEIMTHEGNEKIEHGYYKIMNGQLSLF